MPLLEVVRGPNTSTGAIMSCMTLGKRMKKVSVLAGNCYGFIGNRMLDPYIREAQFLVEEGASPYQGYFPINLPHYPQLALALLTLTLTLTLTPQLPPYYL